MALRVGMQLAKKGIAAGGRGAKNTAKRKALSDTSGSNNYGQTSLIMALNRGEMLRMMKDIQDAVVDESEAILDTDDINFTMELSQSITATVEGDKHYVTVGSPYGWFVEFGTPPGHKVNWQALRRWVVVKLKVPEEEADEVTSRIRNKIMKKGIGSTRFFKRAIKLVIGATNALAPTPEKHTRVKRTKKKKKISRIRRLYNWIMSKIGKKQEKKVEKKSRKRIFGDLKPYVMKRAVRKKHISISDRKNLSQRTYLHKSKKIRTLSKNNRTGRRKDATRRKWKPKKPRKPRKQSGVPSEVKKMFTGMKTTGRRKRKPLKMPRKRKKT